MINAFWRSKVLAMAIFAHSALQSQAQEQPNQSPRPVDQQGARDSFDDISKLRQPTRSLIEAGKDMGGGESAISQLIEGVGKRLAIKLHFLKGAFDSGDSNVADKLYDGWIDSMTEVELGNTGRQEALMAGPHRVVRFEC